MRSKTSKLNQQVLEEASDWFVEFRADDLSPRAREEFHQWLQRSPEHIQAYLEIATTYAELPSSSFPRKADSAGEFDVDALVARARAGGPSNVLPLDVRALKGEAAAGGEVSGGVRGIEAADRRLKPRGRLERVRSSYGLAASLVLALILCGAVTGFWIYSQRDTYSTGIGQQQSIALEDGTLIELNSRSTIRVRYESGERDVELIQGQALFKVAKDHARPFVVRVDGTSVRAVGTQFDVYRKSRGTVVTVIEGRVAVGRQGGQAAASSVEAGTSERPSAARALPGRPVERPGSGDESSRGESTEMRGAAAALHSRAGEILLAAGEQLTATPTTITAPHRADTAAATAWTQRKLVFDNATLGDVAEQFNRYSRRRLTIDPAMANDFHVSGTYSSVNADSLLRFLRAQPGIRVIESEREIRISKE